MGIQIKNTDKNSHLRKEYIPFGVLSTASSISNAQVILALLPNKGVVKRAVLTGTCMTACAGTALHVIVTNPATGNTLIDTSITGACQSGGVYIFSEYQVAIMSATLIETFAAGQVVTVNISACEVAGAIVGYLEVEVDKRNK